MLPASASFAVPATGRLVFHTNQWHGTYQIEAVNHDGPKGLTVGAAYTRGDDTVQVAAKCGCGKLKVGVPRTFRTDTPSAEQLYATLARFFYVCDACALLHCGECQTDRTCRCGTVAVCPACPWAGPGRPGVPPAVEDTTCAECVDDFMCDDCTQYAWESGPVRELESCCAGDRCEGCHADHRKETHGVCSERAACFSVTPVNTPRGVDAV
jgi:hypothetical protein